MADAVVIGAGPNGLVAANLLADAGWEIEVLEAQPEPGGAVRTAELTAPGFAHDVFSAFYPLAAASPAMRGLELERHGLVWRRAPLVLAHAGAEGAVPVLSQDLDETAASLEALGAGDGGAWRRLHELWELTGEHLLDALATPFPPLVAGARLGRAVGAADLVRFLRFGLLPARRLGAQEFTGPGAGLLLAGCALHADLTPDSAGSGLFGWLLCSLGQTLGWPVPEGGAGELTRALVTRLERRGGGLRCNARASAIVVRGGRAVAVRTAAGEVAARRAVLADVGAPALYGGLLEAAQLPAGLHRDVRRFEYDSATVKVDWALDGPIPWREPAPRRAGTVHVAAGPEGLDRYAHELARGLVPARPFLVLGQYSMVDPGRAPAGCETAWAYTHVPRRPVGDAGGEGIAAVWDEREADLAAARIEAQVEAQAPGFRDLIRARHVLTPPLMERLDENLSGGALGGGTAQLHQQLALRPTAGLGRPETPVRGLYLASASAHPGGGVHGAPGANAARAALAAAGLGPRRLGARAALWATRRLAAGAGRVP